MRSLETQKAFERHVELYKASKLSKTKYCKANNLRYHQFNYWVRKTSKQPTVLVPVKIKSVVQGGFQHPDKCQKVLGTLVFGQEPCLKIYDIQAMTSILERVL